MKDTIKTTDTFIAHTQWEFQLVIAFKGCHFHIKPKESYVHFEDWDLRRSNFTEYYVKNLKNVEIDRKLVEILKKHTDRDGELLNYQLILQYFKKELQKHILKTYNLI